MTHTINHFAWCFLLQTMGIHCLSYQFTSQIIIFFHFYKCKLNTKCIFWSNECVSSHNCRLSQRECSFRNACNSQSAFKQLHIWYSRSRQVVFVIHCHVIVFIKSFTHLITCCTRIDRFCSEYIYWESVRSSFYANWKYWFKLHLKLWLLTLCSIRHRSIVRKVFCLFQQFRRI